MSLQTDNLSMIGLGVPDNQAAPPLIGGIHLRWGFLREKGFPWHGFHLFRRPARDGRPLCLSSVTGGLTKGNWPHTKHYTAIGLVSSNTNLVLTDDFTPGTQVEFALDGRQHLRFDLPVGELARRVELRIGFRMACLDVVKLLSQPTLTATGGLPVMTSGVSVFRPNPRIWQGMTFEVKGSDTKPAAQTQFDLLNTTAGALVGLACGYGLTIKLPAPNNTVELLLTPMLTQSTLIEAFDSFDSNANKVATAQMSGVANQPQLVKLTGTNIRRIEIRTLRNTVYLHRICSDRLGGEVGKIEVKLTAFSGTTPIRSFNLSGQGGQIVLATLEADAISAVEIGQCAGALVDLCYVPVAQDAAQGWERLDGFTYPLGLPVTQPDYPCSVAAPQTLLTPQRVPYPLPPAWDNSSFAQLHTQLVALVQGGASAAPMVDRIFSAPPAQSFPPDPQPPQLNNFYVLDMLLLGSLHPALAQLIGLYWADQTAAQNTAYDYLIVADYTGVGQRDASKVLALIQSNGFAQLEGYILFNKSRAAAPPLPAPSNLETYELPGGAFPDAQGQLPLVSNNGGLRWELGWDDFDSLLPDQSVMYLVWRADLGNAAQPAPAGTHNLITKLPPNHPKPLLVTEPRLPYGTVPQRPHGWPTKPLHYIDRNVPDGWYSYQVSGIDLFGRHSLKSTPVLLRLQDKIPPPMPTGVEASALDPADPFLKRDEAYKDWYNSLDSVVRQTLVGLRVRWRWTKAHQQQAPDTSEFRLYFHPGADLPPAHDLAQNWQERLHVVGYNQRYYSINHTERNFSHGGGIGSISIFAASGAQWWAVSSDPSWINITSGASGNGNGAVTYSVAANSSAERTGTIKIAGHIFTINQQDASSTSPLIPVLGTPEERIYEIFLPVPATTAPAGLALQPSLTEPVMYANIGVSAADNKPHTNDKRTTGSWGNRPGNEGHVGAPAKIYRVLRTLPPPPEAILNGERYYASPADYHNHSFFTYRWKPEQFLRLHLFRAMDDGIFKADWAQRPSKTKLDESQLQLFPPGWNKATRQKIAAELNKLDDFPGLENATQQAMAYYRQLSDAALRVLAGLPGSESAFVQLTINPLDPKDAANFNRRGPDNPDDIVLNPNERAFIDTLVDGRAANRYFYRAALVDAAHNLGALGLSSPPVYLPKVFPPKTPVLTKIRGGERLIELRWVKSREADLSAYRVYRTGDPASARDIRKMERVQEIAVADFAPNDNEVSWTDQGVPAGTDFHYRVTALDSEELPNESTPSKVVVGRAVDTVPPKTPEWVSAEWVIYDAQTTAMKPWPKSGVVPLPYQAAIRLELKTTADFCSIYRRVDDAKTWHIISMPAKQTAGVRVVFDLGAVPGQKLSYRAVASNHLEATSPYSLVMVVEAK